MKRHLFKKAINVFFGFLFLAVAGCGKENDNAVEVNYYFSLKNYFIEEAARLQQSNPVVAKKVTLNEKQETKSLAIEDWKNELLTFAEADINKPAFAGKYEADSVRNENKTQRLTYKAKDTKLKTREIKIYFDAETDEANVIEVVLETHNTLYHSTQNLRYEKNKSYSVSGTQEIRFLKKDIFKVEVVF